MSLFKKLLFASFLLLGNTTQSAFISGLNYEVLHHYANVAAQELTYADDRLQLEYHGNLERMFSGRGYADILYPRQKKMLKALSKFIKRTQNAVLYKKFKYEVYKQWKKTFKKNYEASSIANNDDLWGWLHVRCNFPIEE